MSKKSYNIGSQEGADWLLDPAQPEVYYAVGDAVELELEKEQEQALIAAGWLEEAPVKKGKEA